LTGQGLSPRANLADVNAGGLVSLNLLGLV